MSPEDGLHRSPADSAEPLPQQPVSHPRGDRLSVGPEGVTAAQQQHQLHSCKLSL